MDSLDMATPSLYRYKNRNFPINDPLRPKDLDTLLDIQLRETDIFLVAYPKSGSTWMKQILVQIMDAAHPELAEDLPNRKRVPFLEDLVLDEPLRQRPDPRMFGAHLPPDMLPRDVKTKKVKLLYVWRNPKDVLVSSYYFAHSWCCLEPPKSFDEYFEQFLVGDVFMGSCFDHVREYYAERDQLNIHFMKYEDMLKDLKGEVVKLCSFLGQNLTDEDMNRVVEKSTFKNMKLDPRGNYKDLTEKSRYVNDTMRKGIAGDWKNHLTVSQNQRFDQIFTETMSDVPLSFTWE